MYIYTVIPHDIVFEGINDISNDDMETIEYKGIKMEVRTISKSECEIKRILSTDPLCYLSKEFQPGTRIMRNT